MIKKLISYKITCISGNVLIVSLLSKEQKDVITWRVDVNMSFAIFVEKSGQGMIMHAIKTEQINNMKDYLNKMDVVDVLIVANNHVVEHVHLFFSLL